MLTYLCETHFWTSDEDITIKYTDLGAFKYESKKTSPVSVYVEGKRRWTEARGGAWRARGALKGRLRELAELLKTQRTLLCRWAGPNMLLMLFSSGTLAYLLLDPSSARLTRVLYDRYLVGKLLSSNISQVLLTDTHILLTYNDKQAILVSFDRPSIKSTIPEKLSNRDPKLQTVELGAGGGVWGARGSLGVSGSCEGGSALLWSRASPSDLFPWSPHSDNANVHVYTLSGSQMSLLCYHRIEFDPLCVSFSTIHDDIIFSVEQKTSKKGGMVVEWRRLRATRTGCVAAGAAVRLAAPAPATCCARSPCEERLLLACSDRSVLLHHSATNLTTTITASFVARACSWWSGGVVVGGAGAALQAWDTALAPARLAPPGDHAPPDTMLDLGPYFKKEPSLSQLVWNPHRAAGVPGGPGGRFLLGDGLLLLLLRGGPMCCLRLYSAATVMERPVVVRRGQEARALAQLRGTDWGTEGATCLALLHQLLNTLFSAPLSVEREQVAQAALGTFLAPPAPLAPSVRLHHLPHLHDLCRRFFHLLVRYGRLEKALCLAIDVGHADLFMDVHYAARAGGQAQLAQEALQHAHDAASSCASSCSRLSCSRCSSSSGSGSEGEAGPPVARPLDLYGAPPTPRQASGPRRPPPPLPQLTLQPSPPSHPSHPTHSTNSSHTIHSTHSTHSSHSSHPIHSMNSMHSMSPVHPINPIRSMNPTHSIHSIDLFQTDLAENERTLRLDWPRLNLPSLKADNLLNMYSPVYPRGLLSSPAMRSIREELPTAPPEALRPDLTPLAPPQAPPAPPPMMSHGPPSALAVSRYRRDHPPPAQTHTSKSPGEKNKVKFSDTVTVAVVPEIPRKERRPPRSVSSAAPDPRRELADSLPLCHPNHDYLKDFTPHPENEEQEKTSKIKVVHFGVV